MRAPLAYPTTSCFLDANILMYAGGAERPLKEPRQHALERAVDTGASLVTDAEGLQEILHRFFSLRRQAEVLPIQERDTFRALAPLEE